eukprot:Sdes_comp20781_c0_seq7m16870
MRERCPEEFTRDGNQLSGPAVFQQSYFQRFLCLIYRNIVQKSIYLSFQQVSKRQLLSIRLFAPKLSSGNLGQLHKFPPKSEMPFFFNKSATERLLMKTYLKMYKDCLLDSTFSGHVL